MTALRNATQPLAPRTASLLAYVLAHPGCYQGDAKRACGLRDGHSAVATLQGRNLVEVTQCAARWRGHGYELRLWPYGEVGP